MNHNLHDALRSLARTAGDTSSEPSALALANRSVAAVERRHRRRPVVVAGLTGLGVLTAGAAAAVGYSFLQDDDAAPFPDRLTPETTMPSYAPVAITCGAGVGDLVATDAPLALGSESADTANGTPVTLAAETGTGLEMYLRNTSAEPVTITTTQGPGAFLVQDGHVVAIPAPPTERDAVPADATIAPDDTRPLPDDGIVACPDSSGATPTSIPAGDYDAYGVVTVGVEGTPDALEVVGGPWPVRVEAAVEEPTPVTLPAANPDAVFPECGAVVDPPTGMKAVALFAFEAPAPFGTTEVSAPLPATLSISAVNQELYAARGLANMPVLVAVKDGVVVGSSSADPAQVPIEMAGDGGVFPITTGTVVTTLCTDHSTPLPEGRYSIWAAQDFTFSDVYYFQHAMDDTAYVPVDPVTVDVPYRALGQVASLWMDGMGQSVGNPGLAPGWPAATPLDEAFAPGSSDLQSIVWMAITLQETANAVDAALVPSRDALLDLGYTETRVQFDCQVGLGAIGVDQAALERNTGYGAALVFPSSAEAQTFVDLWEPVHGPVLGIVTGGIGDAIGASNLVGWDDTACY